VPNSYEIVDHSFDVIVLGAGGAGLRATLGKVAAGLKRPRHPPPRQRATRRGGSNHRQTDAGEPVENRQGRLARRWSMGSRRVCLWKAAHFR
jgi:hypothetical protein